ncbi:prefoldin subunit 5 [Anaeramoeba flamelloides]|uniref:Prefoldin subunit 5 n=1 Tax=Anaeramoeba flamelloides TaxID=1746091 RepID=A0ABQ8Y5G0_9EUKA|nr:prefoldin subunit 5 [Anaeramoeba flamelloides]
MTNKSSFDLNNLNPLQLNTLKEQISNEYQKYRQSYTQLLEIKSLYSNTLFSLESLQPENLNQPILAPLTESLYLPGKLTNVKSVLTDIGTNFFVERSVEDAQEYFKRQTKIVEEKAQEVLKTMKQNEESLKAVNTVLERKVYQQQKKFMGKQQQQQQQQQQKILKK